MLGCSGVQAATCSADDTPSLAACIDGTGNPIALTADITLSTELALIDRDLTIDGNGNTISGAGSYRVFFVKSGTVVLRNMNIADGLAQGGLGLNGGGGGAGLGGGLFVYDGSVTLNQVSFADNEAAGGTSSGSSALGGGGGMGGNGGGGGLASGDDASHDGGGPTGGTGGGTSEAGGDGGFGGGGGGGGAIFAVKGTTTLVDVLLSGTEYWKYGPTPDDGTDHWYSIPVEVTEASLSFELVDGGLGDDDLTANGSIVDQGGAGGVFVRHPGHVAESALCLGRSL